MIFVFFMTKLIGYMIKYNKYVKYTMYNDQVIIGKGENAYRRNGRENLLKITGTYLVLEADPPAIAGGSAPKTPHF